MNERIIHQRGRARGSEHDAARDRRPTRCVSPSLNAPYARTRATRWPARQYDPGTVSFPSQFLIGALRATRVRSDGFFAQGNGEDRFTPMLDRYLAQGAAPAHKIADFQPHNTPCDKCKTCPDCCQ